MCCKTLFSTNFNVPSPPRLSHIYFTECGTTKATKEKAHTQEPTVSTRIWGWASSWQVCLAILGALAYGGCLRVSSLTTRLARNRHPESIQLLEGLQYLIHWYKICLVKNVVPHRMEPLAICSKASALTAATIRGMQSSPVFYLHIIFSYT